LFLPGTSCCYTICFSWKPLHLFMRCNSVNSLNRMLHAVIIFLYICMFCTPKKFIHGYAIGFTRIDWKMQIWKQKEIQTSRALASQPPGCNRQWTEAFLVFSHVSFACTSTHKSNVAQLFWRSMKETENVLTTNFNLQTWSFCSENVWPAYCLLYFSLVLLYIYIWKLLKL